MADLVEALVYIMVSIRRIIRNSQLLYPMYVRWIIRNRMAVFPSLQTDLHLTGFPRSANTYCYNILKVAFSSLSLRAHIHTTASIQLALRFQVPTLVRDPVSTCCSLLCSGLLKLKSRVRQ